MKNIFSKCLFVLTGLLLFGQIEATAQVGGYQRRFSATDSILTNAQTKRQTFELNSYTDNLRVTMYATKSTGTKAGYITLESSDDGNTFVRFKSLESGSVAIDSLLFSNTGPAIQYKTFDLGTFKGRFLRATAVSTGTQVTYFKVLATWKTRP